MTDTTSKSTAASASESSPGARTTLASRVDAAPFVPAQSAAVPLPRNASTGSLGASSVRAAPFVPGANASANQRLSQAAASAPPFMPGNPASAAGRPAGSMSSTAAPFVPKAPTEAPGRLSATAGGFASPRPKAGRTNTAGASPARAAGARLPDSDDLLGMTAHTPASGLGTGGRAAAGGVSRSAGDAAEQAAATAGQHGNVLSPPQRPTQSYAQPPLRSPAKGRGASLPGYQAPSGPGRGPAFGRGRMALGPAPPGGRGRRGPVHAGAGYQPGLHGYGPGRTQAAAAYMADRLQQDLQQRSRLLYAQADPEAEHGDMGLPAMVHHYHTLYPLEDLAAAEEVPSQAFGLCTAVLKGLSSVDGGAYALRRLDSRQVLPTGDLTNTAQQVVDAWSALAQHPHLLTPQSAFVSHELDGQPALFFAHEYIPGAATLEAAHIQPVSSAAGLVRNSASEDQMWSYLVQLTSAMRAAHSAGLALRAASLLPSKVLVTGTGRLRVGSLGVGDLVAALEGSGGGREDPAQLGREDMAAVGRLLLALACAGTGGPPSLDAAAALFSGELVRLVQALLAAADGGALASVRQLAGVLGERCLGECEALQCYGDVLAGELGRQADSGRLLRVAAKLAAVCERPEGDMDPQWSETGDRYLVKLFRDFVFHQTNEDGSPLLEWGHVAEALHKLDAGLPERILLLSRDEQSMLVVSYADMKRCVETAFNELKARGVAARNHVRSQQRARPA